MKTLKQIVAGTLIASGLLFNLGCEESDSNSESKIEPEINYDNINLPAEDYNSREGRTEGRPRSNAEDRYSIVIYSGTKLNYDVKLMPNSEYIASVRYSNDGTPDNLVLFLNGNNVGDFFTEDTREAGMRAGEGWNNFKNSPEMRFTTGSETNYQFSVYLANNSYEAEVDNMTLTRQQ